MRITFDQTSFDQLLVTKKWWSNTLYRHVSVLATGSAAHLSTFWNVGMHLPRFWISCWQGRAAFACRTGSPTPSTSTALLRTRTSNGFGPCCVTWISPSCKLFLPLSHALLCLLLVGCCCLKTLIQNTSLSHMEPLYKVGSCSTVDLLDNTVYLSLPGCI